MRSFSISGVTSRNAPRKIPSQPHGMRKARSRNGLNAKPHDPADNKDQSQPLEERLKNEISTIRPCSGLGSDAGSTGCQGQHQICLRCCCRYDPRGYFRVCNASRLLGWLVLPHRSSQDRVSQSSLKPQGGRCRNDTDNENPQSQTQYYKTSRYKKDKAQMDRYEGDAATELVNDLRNEAGTPTFRTFMCKLDVHFCSKNPVVVSWVMKITLM